MPTPIQQLQTMLHNRQYRDETTPEIIQFAKDNNLVIVFGSSDDLVEFCGAIDDERYAHIYTEIFLSKQKILTSECELGSSCPHWKELNESMPESIKKITINGNHPYWTYQVDFAHLTFDILEDEDKYCEGIIFSLDIFNPV